MQVEDRMLDILLLLENRQKYLAARAFPHRNTLSIVTAAIRDGEM